MMKNDQPKNRRAPRREIDGVEHVFTYAIVDCETGVWEMFSGAFTRDEIDDVMANRGPSILRELWMSMAV